MDPGILHEFEPTGLQRTLKSPDRDGGQRLTRVATLAVPGVRPIKDAYPLAQPHQATSSVDPAFRAPQHQQLVAGHVPPRADARVVLAKFGSRERVQPRILKFPRAPDQETRRPHSPRGMHTEHGALPRRWFDAEYIDTRLDGNLECLDDRPQVLRVLPPGRVIR